MKKRFINLIGPLILLLSINANAGLIYLEESGRVGNEVSVSLKGSGFNEGLAAGSFYASWDSSLFEFIGISFNETLYDFVNYVNYVDQSSGYLDDGLFSALVGVDPVITAGEFEIATLTFGIIAEGFSRIDVAQGWGFNGTQPYYDPNFNEITDISYGGTNISVPEPASILLFLGALFGLSRTRRLSK